MKLMMAIYTKNHRLATHIAHLLLPFLFTSLYVLQAPYVMHLHISANFAAIFTNINIEPANQFRSVQSIPSNKGFLICNISLFWSNMAGKSKELVSLFYTANNHFYSISLPIRET